MALPTVFWNSSTSTTPTKQIPVNHISSIEKFQVGTDPNDATKQEVSLLMIMDEFSPVRTIKLVYPGTTSAATTLRNASYAAIMAIIATTTV